MRLNEQPWAVHTGVPEGSPAQELGCPGSPWASHRLLFRSSQSLHISAAGGAKSLQLCLTLHDPMDCSLPGSSDHGIHSPGKNIGMDCHFLLQGIFPRRDGTHVSPMSLMIPALAGQFFVTSATLTDVRYSARQGLVFLA